MTLDINSQVPTVRGPTASSVYASWMQLKQSLSPASAARNAIAQGFQLLYLQAASLKSRASYAAPVSYAIADLCSFACAPDW